ncbi:CTL2-like protein, partial [Mya arenaria]
MPGKEEAYKPGEEMEMEEMNDFTDRGYGKPLQFDPKFRGPISKRSCTDIICCFIFMVFVVGMAVVGYFAFSYGDPRLLLGKNNLLFYDLLACGKMGAGVFVDGCPTTQICVEECPTKNVYYKLGILHRCVPKVLADLIDEIGSLESNLKNASITTVTDKNGNDFTQTDIVDSLDAYGLFLKAKEYGEKVIQDVVASWWMILEYFGVKDTEQSFHIHMAVLTFTFSKEKFWLGFGILSIAILAIVLLILLILCQRIRIAIALIKESSSYLASSGREPTFDLMNGTDTIFSNGSYNYDVIKRQTGSLFEEIPCDNEVNTTLSEYTIYLQIYNLFMLFWLVNFCIALGEMALAGAFASYYWAFEKPRDIPTFPLCLKCCFWCLEKFIRFLNRNAYIMVAIHGKNFCSSAKTAFLLIMRNVVRVLVVDKVVDFLLFVGKLLVVGGVACASYFFFDGQIEFLKTYQPSLNFYVVPVVLVTIGSYVVASCFFSLEKCICKYSCTVLKKIIF